MSRPASTLLRRAAVSGPLLPRPVTAVHLQQARFINLHEYQSVDVMGNVTLLTLKPGNPLALYTLTLLNDRTLMNPDSSPPTRTRTRTIRDVRRACSQCQNRRKYVLSSAIG
jgi:hypothetical protein